MVLAVAAVQPAMGQDATWLASPATGDYSTNANWSTGLVLSGTAFFGTSSITSLSFSPNFTTVGGWTFNAGASAYSFTNPANLDLSLNGAGIVVNGGSATFTNNGYLRFNNSSSAGGATITNNAYQYFNNSSTAGNATITFGGSSNLTFVDTQLVEASFADFKEAVEDGDTARSTSLVNALAELALIERGIIAAGSRRGLRA